MEEHNKPRRVNDKKETEQDFWRKKKSETSKEGKKSETNKINKTNGCCSICVSTTSVLLRSPTKQR